MIATVRSPWTVRLLWFIVPSLIGAAGWWWSMQQFVTGHFNLEQNVWFSLSLSLVIGLLGLALWMGSAMMSIYVISWRSVRICLALVVTMPILIFFPVSLLTVAAWLLTAGGLAWSFEQTAADAHNRLTIKPWQTINQNLAIVTTAIMIAVGILSFQQSTKANSTEPAIDRLTNQVVTLTEKILPNVF